MIDGTGFAVAFLVSDTLWIPVIWYLSKNFSVWLILGKGTIDLVPGPFVFNTATVYPNGYATPLVTPESLTCCHNYNSRSCQLSAGTKAKYHGNGVEQNVP